MNVKHFWACMNRAWCMFVMARDIGGKCDMAVVAVYFFIVIYINNANFHEIKHTKFLQHFIFIVKQKSTLTHSPTSSKQNENNL